MPMLQTTWKSRYLDHAAITILCWARARKRNFSPLQRKLGKAERERRACWAKSTSQAMAWPAASHTSARPSKSFYRSLSVDVAERQARGLFEAIEHDRGVHVFDAGVRQEHVIENARERLQVRDHQFDKVVGRAGHGVGLLHLIEPIDEASKALGVVR